MELVVNNPERLKVILLESANRDMIEAHSWEEVRHRVWISVNKRKFFTENAAHFGMAESEMDLGNTEVIVVPEGVACQAILSWWKAFTPVQCVPIGFTASAAEAARWADSNLMIHAEA